METLTIKLPSGSLASRASAVPFRQKIQQGLEEGKTVILDLSDVDVISGATESSKALLSGLQSILDKSNVVLFCNHDDLNENK